MDGKKAVIELSHRKNLLLAVLLVTAIFLAYSPCWRGGAVWDDDVHITAPALQSWHGLARIWIDVRATSQYYPLLHTVFWLEHVLWGNATLGYHLVNLFWHSLAALLVLAIIRRLAIPGAWLAAAIFALHPVQVESVAWISEQKNTLSAVFYLSAALAYLHFDEDRTWKWYVAAAALFAAAILTKTVTATLPGALLVLFWWRRGRLSWRRDVLPLVPFFAAGAGFGLFSAWWELKVNRCTGPDFAFTFLDRVLIAGRTLWFCTGKLFWPANLCFLYPRWTIDSHAASQYLYPLAAVALLVAAWCVRRRTRVPLAGLLYFGGTLFPVLGFFNLYTFRYSFVADHYQYLACLGLIVPVAAAAGFLIERAGERRTPQPRHSRHKKGTTLRERKPAPPASDWDRTGSFAALALLAGLAILTWKQSWSYADARTLYEATLGTNPDCWLAYNNLGELYVQDGELDAAKGAYFNALEHNPKYPDPHVNLGLLAEANSQPDVAKTEYREALNVDPANAAAHNNLGRLAVQHEQLDEAVRQFKAAIDARPAWPEAHANLGNVLANLGHLDEAVAEYRTALEINPGDVETQSNLRTALDLLDARSRR